MAQRAPVQVDLFPVTAVFSLCMWLWAHLPERLAPFSRLRQKAFSSSGVEAGQRSVCQSPQARARSLIAPGAARRMYSATPTLQRGGSPHLCHGHAAMPHLAAIMRHDWIPIPARRPYCVAVTPPSTKMFCPVIMADASEAKNMAIPTKSEVSQTRPSGMRSTRERRNSASFR